MDKKILNFCLEKGMLVDKEVLSLFSEAGDLEFVKLILEKIRDNTGRRIITKDIFNKSKEKVSEVFSLLPKENQRKLEKLKIKLGLSIEISKEIVLEKSEDKIQDIYIKKLNDEVEGVKVNFKIPEFSKKLEVKDFIKYFRNRFFDMKNILQEHSELDNLVSINKISGNKQGISVIGIIYDKRITQNKNILFEIEDLTGKIRILVSQNKPEIYKKAEDISLDSVIGFKCSGSREILFANDIIFPESVLPERKKSSVEEYALFLGDLHFGSKLFLEENFLKFIDYLNGKISNTPEVEKIKYLFIVGDVITGIGNYPNQEKDLEITDLEEQFEKVAELLGMIRKDIKIIVSPGNHDCVRLMEPQPKIDEKYAWPFSDLKNVILTTNPCNVNIGARGDFPGFNVLTYHGFSFPFYADNVPKLMIKKAMNIPERIMKYLLKNRHLSPTHASTQYFPSEQDTSLIRNVPDIFVAAHTHKSAVSYYNNILVISTSCWESMTPYQEKFGNKPDHCKVPMFNLKTRAVKILDFE